MDKHWTIEELDDEIGRASVVVVRKYHVVKIHDPKLKRLAEAALCPPSFVVVKTS